MNEEKDELLPVKQETEIVTLGEGVGSLDFASDAEVDDFIQRIERRNNAIDRLLKNAFKRLKTDDFLKFGKNTYYLDGEGAQRVMKYLGISCSNVTRIPSSDYETIKDDPAKRGRVTFRGDFTLGVLSSVGIGMKDTKDNFICKANGEYKQLGDIKLLDLDRGAKTQMYSDGICTLLGLKGITREMLIEFGFDPDKIKSVSFETGTKGGSMAGGDEETQKKQTKITDMIFELSEQDPAKAEEKLIEYSKYTYKGKEVKGVKSASMLSPGRTKVVYGKVKKDYGDQFGGQPPTEKEDPEEKSQPELGF